MLNSYYINSADKGAIGGPPLAHGNSLKRQRLALGGRGPACVFSRRPCQGDTPRRRVRLRALWLVLILAVPAWAQAGLEDYRVYLDHPRLLLTPRRSRLLKRERERQSMRWQQFDSLMQTKAPVPEPGFALALHYHVTGEQAAGRQAVKWALGGARDARQMAIVFDWCQPLLAPSESLALQDRLRRVLEADDASTSPDSFRQRSFAAIALAGHVKELPERRLRDLVEREWKRGIVETVGAGKNPIPRGEHYALYEMLHVVRDNLNLDLTETVPGFFKEFPIYHLAGHYPAPYPAAEGEYQIPAEPGSGPPDLREAALSRAAGLAMVAYHPNALETQFLQGWLMRDRFILLSPFGAPYEFLWANPYHPGLSYQHVPLYFRQPAFNAVFARDRWDEDALWMGHLEGELQVMNAGNLTALKPGAGMKPLRVGSVTALFGESPMRLQYDGKPGDVLLLLGMKPGVTYQIEVDDEELREERADVMGVLEQTMHAMRPTGVRLREAPHPHQATAP